MFFLMCSQIAFGIPAYHVTVFIYIRLKVEYYSIAKNLMVGNFDEFNEWL